MHLFYLIHIYIYIYIYIYTVLQLHHTATTIWCLCCLSEKLKYVSGMHEFHRFMYTVSELFLISDLSVFLTSFRIHNEYKRTFLFAMQKTLFSWQQIQSSQDRIILQLKLLWSNKNFPCLLSFPRLAKTR